MLNLTSLDSQRLKQLIKLGAGQRNYLTISKKSLSALTKGLAYLYTHSRKRYVDVLSLKPLASFNYCQLFPPSLGQAFGVLPP